jgi:uncharacterized protein Usg
MKCYSTPDLLLELQGYRLTTAEILYCLPDYPELLQTFIWQNLDLSPDFPRLHAFLSYWQNNIEGKLYSVKVAQAEVINIVPPRFAKEEFHLH